MRLAAASIIVSARSITNTRREASNGVRVAAATTASSTSETSSSCAPEGVTHVRSGCDPSAAHSFVLAQQRGGHGPRDGALPGARRPVEQVGVAGRGAGGQRRLEHGARVGMVLEGGQGRHRCRS